MVGMMVVGWLVLLATFGANGQELSGRPDDRAQYENVARGKPYVLYPRPNYEYTKADPHTLTRLTDGEYTDQKKERFWTQPTTIGWASSTAEITLDLGEHYGIRGLLVGTALSTGTDVMLPESIEVLVSIDGRRYHPVGDLVKMDTRPRPVGYNQAFRLQTDQLMVHGRYVKLIVHKGGRHFIFLDEIEVFRGSDAWKVERPLPGPAVEYAMTVLENPFSLALKARLDSDLKDARSAVVRAALPSTGHARLLAEADAIQRAMDAMPELRTSRSFRGTYPLNNIHARIYALYGALRKAQGRVSLIAWRANPWDYLRPADLPAEPPAARIDIAAMRGETRVGALNLTNSTEKPRKVRIAIDGLPGGSLATELKVREVAWTDTFARVSIGAALPLAKRSGRGWKITIPAGMTRQVWFEVTPRQTLVGVHSGEVVVSSAGAKAIKAPFSLRVFNLTFPEKSTLKLGGFEYSDRPSSSTSYGVTHKNVEAFVAHLKARHVRHTWASTWVMPQGSFKPDGTFKQAPDTALFDNWIARWPNVDGYYVYNFAPFWEGKIGGTGPEDPLFAKKMSEWARFWAGHARRQGVLGRLWLVPVDEPHERAPADTAMFVAWSRAIKAAAPELLIWLDPYYADPAQVPKVVWSLADAVSPLWAHILRNGEDFQTFYRSLQRGGKRLEFYVIANVLADPYTDYRLPAWWAYDMKAEAISYWAFGDNGGGEGDSWNQYAQQYTSYSPLFLTPESVTAGKHMESIREGIQDFEYLAMLRDRVNKLTAVGSMHPLLPSARILLAGAVVRVTQAEGVKQNQWLTPKDRSAADTVRVEIADMLERLAQ